MNKEELLNELDKVELTIDDLKRIMLKHFVREGLFGRKILELKYLDFSDFDGDVFVNSMIVRGDLFQNNQKVAGNLFQDKQDVQGDLWQDCQNVSGDLCQDKQEVDGEIYQDELEEEE